MTSKLWTLLTCISLSGCAAIPSITQSELAHPSIRPRIDPAEVAAFPAGSRLEISHDQENFHEKFVGTVLKAGPQGVAMVNCEHSSRSIHSSPVLRKTPILSRFVKNTGVGMQKVPVQWVPIRKIDSAQVLAPPPEDYVAPQLAINTDDTPYFERIGIEFPTTTGTVRP